ncbi:MAG: hypothetical protein ACI8Z1_002888 [Candidatus Azotimanducaceae bacterium]|jgi:hypothetical protein
MPDIAPSFESNAHFIITRNRPDTVSGIWLFGAARFEIQQAAGPFETCHCNRCSNVSGGQGLPMVRVSLDDFELTQGAECVVSFDAPILYQAPAYKTHRCSVCGMPVPSSYPGDELLEIPAGRFDDAEISPDEPSFKERVPQWDRITDGLPQCDLPALIATLTGEQVDKDFVVKSHQHEASEVH